MVAEVGDEKKVAGVHRTVSTRLLGLSPLQWHGVLAVLVIAASVLTQGLRKESCMEELNSGQWIEGEWHPYTCTTHQYSIPGEVRSCFDRMLYDRVFLSEGTLTTKIGHLLKEFEPKIISEKEASSEYSVIKEHLNKGERILMIHQLPTLVPESRAEPQNGMETCKKNVFDLILTQEDLFNTASQPCTPSSPSPSSSSSSSSLPSCLTLVQLEVPLPENAPLSAAECNHVALDLYRRLNKNHSSFIYLTPFADGSKDESEQLSIVLNSFCNQPWASSCCTKRATRYYLYWVLPVLILILAVYTGVWLIFASGATFALTPHLEAASFDLQNLFAVFNSVAALCLCLLYCVLADGLGYFHSQNKRFSPHLFSLWLLLVCFAGVLGWRKAKQAEFMSRVQVRETKGWIVLLLLAIGYTAMDKVVVFRLLSQLLVSGLLFLSCYGHFCYFWSTGDYSWQRVVKVLVRMNFVPLCLYFSLGSFYGTYFLVALYSASFLFTYAVMAAWPQVTKSSMLGSRKNQLIVVVKLLVLLFLIVLFTPSVDHLCPIFSLPLLRRVFASPDGSVHHWCAMLHQQRLVPVLAVMFGCAAVVLPETVLKGCSSARLWLAALGASLLLLISFGYYLSTCDQTCSELLSYTAVLPIIGYVLMRNSTPFLRDHYSILWALCGSLVLLLFSSQVHVLLTLNGSGLLVLFSEPLALNALAVTIIFSFFIRTLASAGRTLLRYSTTKHKCTCAACPSPSPRPAPRPGMAPGPSLAPTPHAHAHAHATPQLQGDSAASAV